MPTPTTPEDAPLSPLERERDRRLETILDEMVASAVPGPDLPPDFTARVMAARPFAAWELRRARAWRVPALAAGGLLASTWLPSMIDGSFTTPALPGLFGSLLFVYLNLHHYAIDATIWRSSGEHVKRISKGPAVVEVSRPASTPVAQPALV